MNRNSNLRIGRSLALLAAMVAPSCNATLTGPEALEQDLDFVRAANARYQDFAVAVRDGFERDSPCLSSPSRGAMGMHYIKRSRVDGLVVAEEPEILLYIQEGGQMRLVGVEYMTVVYHDGAPYFGSAAPTVTSSAPTMFGRTFEGPMAGHNPSMPWHYDLHVWLWRENPAGTFAQFNSTLSCS